MATPNQKLSKILASKLESGELVKAIQYTLNTGDSLPEELTTYLKYIETEGFNDLPKITIVDPEYLNGYLGAYAPSTQTIFISSALATSPSLTDVVLMHEYAHYLASKYLDNKYVSDSTINRFVAELIPNTYPMLEALSEAESKGAKKIDFLNGESLAIETFDTHIHNSLDSKLFAGFTDASKKYLALGQNHADDPAPSNRFALQYRSAVHFDNNNITGGLQVVQNWYEDALSNFDSTSIQERKWDYVRKNDEAFLKGVERGVNKFIKTAFQKGVQEAVVGAFGSIQTVVSNGVTIPLPNFNDPNFISGKVNPGFSGVNAGLELLLYRFGQINHALQDFYTHSNWISLIGEANTGKPFKEDTLLDSGYALPQLISPGQLMPGNHPGIEGKRQVMLVSSLNNTTYEKILKPSVELNYTKISTNNLKDAISDFNSIIKNPEGFLLDGNTLGLQKNLFNIPENEVYWRVDSTITSANGAEALKDPVLKATLKSGQDIFGIASGATWDLLYKDQDYNVPLVDTNMIGMTISRALYKGFDHGGIAGTSNILLPDPYNFFSSKKSYNAYLGPMSRDSEKVPGHEEALYYATLQTRHEWDRLGNLIFARHGETGLKRFAEFALGTEYQKKYIDTYKVPGGKWTDWPNINKSEQYIYFSPDYQSTDSNAPKYDFRFITVVSYNPDEKGFTSDLQLQFSPAGDGIYNNWTDSENTYAWYSIDRHGDGITSELIQQLIVPKSTPRTEEENRAFWTGPNNDDNSDGFGTIYYVEARNPIIPIIIPNFNTGVDKIVFIDNNGNREGEAAAHWGEKNYYADSQELQKNYNVYVNSAPASFKIDPAWLININDLVKASGTSSGLVYTANNLFRDIDEVTSSEQVMRFVDLQTNAPFLKLVEGNLVALDNVIQYVGKEFEAKLQVTDGAGGSCEDTLRIVIDPSLQLSGDISIDPGQFFELKYAKQGPQINSIYVSIDINNGTSDVEYFGLLSSISGSINGNPTGYDPFTQHVRIGSQYDSGIVNFYLNSSDTDELIKLDLVPKSDGTYQLFNGRDLYATLKESTSDAVGKSLPFEVDRFSLINTSGTVAGVRTDAITGNSFVLNYSTHISAAYTSKFGFYLTDVRYGNIIDPITGQMIVPNTEGLTSLVDQYKVFESDIVANNANGQAVINFDNTIDIRNIVLTPYIKTDTGKNTYTYGCDAALNPDGFDHVARMGFNLFGIEDMFGGGDRDFNDILIGFDSLMATTTP